MVPVSYKAAAATMRNVIVELGVSVIWSLYKWSRRVVDGVFGLYNAEYKAGVRAQNNAKRLVAHESPQPARSGSGGRAACVVLGLATDAAAALHTSELYALAAVCKVVGSLCFSAGILLCRSAALPLVDQDPNLLRLPRTQGLLSVNS